MEITTIPVEDDPRRYEETLWRVEAEYLRPGERVRSIGQYAKIVNVFHKVAIHTHTGALPAWGFGQQEINGNKNMNERANMWFFEEVQVAYDDEGNNGGPSLFAQAAEAAEAAEPVEGMSTDVPYPVEEEGYEEEGEEWKPDEDSEYDPKTLVHTPATATGAPAAPKGTGAPQVVQQQQVYDKEEEDPLGELFRKGWSIKKLNGANNPAFPAFQPQRSAFVPTSFSNTLRRTDTCTPTRTGTPCVTPTAVFRLRVNKLRVTRTRTTPTTSGSSFPSTRPSPTLPAGILPMWRPRSDTCATETWSGCSTF